LLAQVEIFVDKIVDKNEQWLNDGLTQRAGAVPGNSDAASQREEI
jgi:hypothetical protein